MSAYNRYHWESATGSHRLLTGILRDEWGFDGYVVSDCGAVTDIWRNHKIAANEREAASVAVKAGCDLNCGISWGPKADANTRNSFQLEPLTESISGKFFGIVKTLSVTR